MEHFDLGQSGNWRAHSEPKIGNRLGPGKRTTMTSTYTESASAPVAGAAYGGLADVIGGIATIVLAIIALTGVHPETIMSIAVIVFGATLLIQGGTVLSEYEAAVFPVGTAGASPQQFGLGGLSTLFLAGVAGIVLGVLALIGIAAETLTAISVIAFGSALLLSSNSLRHLSRQTSSSRSSAPRTGAELLGSEMASGSAGVQMLAGLAVIVLGIVALVVKQNNLTPAALIVLGAAVILTGTALTGLVIGFVRTTTRGRPATP